jgi:hypothetical protein
MIASVYVGVVGAAYSTVVERQYLARKSLRDFEAAPAGRTAGSVGAAGRIEGRCAYLDAITCFNSLNSPILSAVFS